jgi:hypothetical protein
MSDDDVRVAILRMGTDPATGRAICAAAQTAMYGSIADQRYCLETGRWQAQFEDDWGRSAARRPWPGRAGECLEQRWRRLGPYDKRHTRPQRSAGRQRPGKCVVRLSPRSNSALLHGAWVSRVSPRRSAVRRGRCR